MRNMLCRFMYKKKYIDINYNANMYNIIFTISGIITNNNNI